MNIQLVYEDNTFSFDVQPGKTIDYLKDLSCKIFNLKKESCELVYNNQIISGFAPNLTIKKIISNNEELHIIHIRQKEVIEQQPKIPKKETKPQYITKYTKEIDELKEKINQFDSSYQEMLSQISTFKLNLEEIIQKIITAMNEFKDYAVMIDTLLDNKEEFNDLSLIKSDILNFDIEKDDNDNLKKINIFNQKIESYHEKTNSIKYRKKYQDFIFDLLNCKIPFYKTLSNELELIKGNFRKEQIDNLIIKYSTTQQKLLPKPKSYNKLHSQSCSENEYKFYLKQSEKEDEQQRLVLKLKNDNNFMRYNKNIRQIKNDHQNETENNSMNYYNKNIFNISTNTKTQRNVTPAITIKEVDNDSNDDINTKQSFFVVNQKNNGVKLNYKKKVSTNSVIQTETNNTDNDNRNLVLPPLLLNNETVYTSSNSSEHEIIKGHTKSRSSLVVGTIRKQSLKKSMLGLANRYDFLV